MTLKSVKHFTAAHYVQKNSVSFNKINAIQLLIYGCDRVDVHHCFLRSWLYRHLLVLKWRCSLRWAAVDFSGRSGCFFWGGAHSHCKCVCLCESTAMPRLMLSLTAIPATHTFFKNCIWYQYTVCEQWWSNNVPDNYCSAAAIKRFGFGFVFFVLFAYCIYVYAPRRLEIWSLI